MRVGYVGQPKQVIAVGAGFLVAQLFWLIVAILGLIIMCRYTPTHHDLCKIVVALVPA